MPAVQQQESKMGGKELVDLTSGPHISQNQVKKDLTKRTCVLMPIDTAAQSQGKDRKDPATLFLHQHQRTMENHRRLPEELARIEEELGDCLRKEVERQRMLNVIRQEDNRLRWSSLCFLQLNQRLKRPVVSSYYKNIPMYIYCLPIQTVAKNRGYYNKKRKKWIL
ncbi:hypothetical protein DPEC_G00082420 [Dallia pectoralis]|uniref:Uncharacterized protein n=1 Tax=Dallia pectoralis TaxID=75939 RepID=A0ACC2GYW7_DALPE|nr:hypothetical protein DPEC_G00082420 [Dallia pectoralis]